MENLSISIYLGGKVMDNMKEMRNKVQDGKYNLTLEVAEGAYFGTYDDVDTKSGEDLVRNYLRSNSDDANFNDIKIKYNKNRRAERMERKFYSFCLFFCVKLRKSKTKYWTIFCKNLTMNQMTLNV